MAENSPIVLERCRATSTSAEGRFRIGKETHTVRFDGVAPDPQSAADAFVAIARIMGMETDQKIISVPRLSRRFRQQIDVMQQVHLSLFPTHHEAPIHSLQRSDRPALDGDDRRVAAFFSGGIDSFDLVVEFGDIIDDLIFVRGFDIVVHDRERNAEVLAMVQKAADAVGKPLMVIDTDLRDFSDSRANWTWFVYGGLIATSMLLERTHHTVLCAASLADQHLPEVAARLRGTPFGNERVSMRIEGRGTTRVEKSETVAASGLARDNLRVCWQNIPGTMNCGTCQKCLRTQIALAASGSLEAIDTLPHEVDMGAVAAHPVGSRSDRAFLAEIRDVAVVNGKEALVAALDVALAG